MTFDIYISHGILDTFEYDGPIRNFLLSISRLIKHADTPIFRLQSFTMLFYFDHGLCPMA